MSKTPKTTKVKKFDNLDCKIKRPRHHSIRQSSDNCNLELLIDKCDAVNKTNPEDKIQFSLQFQLFSL